MLISCPECGRAVSDFAPACPNCGLPRNMFERAKKSRASLITETVDLGLPSGTLWADSNVGAKSPYDIGMFFSWGDSTIKEIFDWDNYKYFLGNYINCESNVYPRLSKYVCHKRLGIIDNKSYVEPSDDPATTILGQGWSTPSYEQQQELLRHCRIEKTAIKGVHGYTLYGPNGKSIFLINTGYIKRDCLKDKGRPIFWLNQANPSGYENATAFSIIETFNGITLGTAAHNRCEGLTIRAVRN